MTSRAILAARVLALREHGYLYREIADALDISMSYAAELGNDPTGAKAATRKRAYAGVCQGCGEPTTGCNGRDQAPEWCAACRPNVDAYWSPEAIIAAIRAFHAVHGRTPTATEYHLRNGLPTPATTAKHFASLNGAVEVAGFERREIGRWRGSKAITQERVIAELQAVAVDGVLPLHFWARYSAIKQRIALTFPGGSAEAYAAAGVRPHGRRKAAAS